MGTAGTQVLLIGSGLTSAITAYSMRSMYKNTHKIAVFERARGMGGRMGTTRNPNRADCMADLGMQYITATPHYSEVHKTFYQDLQTEEILKLVPIPNLFHGYKARKPGLKFYVAPKGAGAIVKYFFNKSDTDVRFEQDVRAMDVVTNEPDRPLWRVTLGSGTVEHFDSVIVTIPVPEVLQLTGNIQEVIDKLPQVRSNLEKVVYSSRFALGMFYDSPIPVEVEYAGSYLKDRMLRYISIENRKRGDEMPTSIVVHTSKTFGAKHIEETVENVQSIILNRMPEFIPNLPTPSFVRCIKWKYSQVLKPYGDAPGFIIVKDKPLLILAGDGFTESTFDGCIASGLRVANKSRSIFTRVFKKDPRP